MALPKTSASRIANICKNISLSLASCLAFLVPFDPVRNIDLQSWLLLISGGFAWIAVLFGHRKLLASLDRLSRVLLGVFAISCLISCLASPHFGYDFLGAPYIRLGFGGFAACIGIGLLAGTIPRQRLISGLYALIVGLAVIALPHSWLSVHSLLRVGGVFAQADILACFLGCGLVLGFGMLSLYPKYRKLLIFVQVFLAVMLLLTQTRAVLLLIIFIGFLWLLQHRNTKTFKLACVYIVASLALVVALHYAAPNRLTDTGYASQSFHYRLSLQRYALQAAVQKPLWGYGPGNLADALDCPRLLEKSLRQTCNEGYFFNSSHNIFIDRVLAVGWLGGLAFLGLVLLVIYRNLRDKSEQRIWGYALLLISGYYVTNVTGVPLELLFWILLFQCLVASVKTKRRL